MKFRRLFTSIMLLVIMCVVFMICTPDSQAYSYIGICGDNLTYFHLANGTLYISGSGEMNDYSESDPAPWHEVADSITGLSIGSGVTGIGSYAFANCKNLRTIYEGSGITSIGSYAFYNCTSLTSIPSGVISIGTHAFAGCYNLSSMPSNVTSMGSYAFRDCTGLLFASFKGESMGVGSFYGCTSLKTVSLYSGLTVIPENVFYNCSSLTSISFPDSITVIESGAFEGCSAIESFNLPSGINTIGSDAFKNCTSLTSFTIPEGLTSLEEGVFSGCTSMGSVAVHNNVISIGKEAFKDCKSLLGIVLPKSVTEIGEGAFAGCSSLLSVSLTDGIENIANGTFKDCISITYMEMPTNVKRIGEEAFGGCTALAAISLNEGLTEIADNAFTGCTSLTGCVLPSSINIIGNGIFIGCTSMQSVKFMGYLTRWKDVTIGADNKLLSAENIITQYIDGGNIGNGIYWGVSSDGCLSISGDGEMSDFELNNTPWTKYAESITRISVDKNITSIGAYSFAGLVKLTEAVLPDGITEIADGMFFGCTALQTVTGFEKINYIGESAFESCISLLFDNAFDVILGKRAFAGCISLKKLSISSANIGEEAFADCTALKSVIIRNTVTEIGVGAFYNCPLELASFAGTEDELAALIIGDNNSKLKSIIDIHYYIRNIYISSGAGRGEAEALIAEKADEILSFNMSSDSSGYICLGYSLTNDPDEALTGIILYSADEDCSDGSVDFNGVTYYLISTPVFTDDNGNCTYVCTTKDISAGEPVYMIGLLDNGSGKSTFRNNDAWMTAENADGNASSFDGTSEGICLFYTRDIDADIKAPLSIKAVIISAIVILLICLGAGTYFLCRKKGKNDRLDAWFKNSRDNVIFKFNTLKNTTESKYEVDRNIGKIKPDKEKIQEKVQQIKFKKEKSVAVKEKRAEKKIKRQIAKELKKDEKASAVSQRSEEKPKTGFSMK